MCLYTRMVENPKYLPNKKNKGIVPECKDERVRWVPIACGNCIECRKMRAREWKVRIHEELKHDNKALFVTLTINEKWMDELIKDTKSEEANKVAGLAIRRFTERWRKEFKVTVRHWLIVELGHKNTERMHMHGILWTNEKKEKIEEKWMYGGIWIGYDMTEKCVNYIMKYVTKADKDHPDFKGRIYTSKGLGKKYTNSYNAKDNKKKMKDTYTMSNGTKVAMPIYYRNKIFTEDEKEKMWIEKIDKQEMWVNGNKICIKTEEGQRNYERAVERQRLKSERLGYGKGDKQKKYFAKKTLKDLDIKKGDHIFDDIKLKKRRLK